MGFIEVRPMPTIIVLHPNHMTCCCCLCVLLVPPSRDTIADVCMENFS